MQFAFIALFCGSPPTVCYDKCDFF